MNIGSRAHPPSPITHFFDSMELANPLGAFLQARSLSLVFTVRALIGGFQVCIRCKGIAPLAPVSELQLSDHMAGAA